MNKIIGLSLLTPLFFCALSFAQSMPAYQQSGRSSNASNIAAPLKHIDSFMGQEKRGPYVLSWRNIVSPISVYVDNNLVPAFQYTVDLAKGEINFNNNIKKNQIVNVQFGYYPEMAIKNANPSQIDPFKIKLATLGFNNLNLITANNSNSNLAPSMILNINNRIGGFTSNYFINPTGNKLESQNAMQLGYKASSTRSNFIANYEKSDKGFSTFAKSVGVIDSAERSNIAGDFSPNNRTKISFQNNEMNSLNSSLRNSNNNASINFNGGKNSPVFNYTISSVNNTDAKNIESSNTNKQGNFISNLGQLNLSFKTSSADSINNNIRTLNNQDNLSLSLNQLKFNKIDEHKIDPKTGEIKSSVNSIGYNTKVLGGSFSYASNDSNVLTTAKSYVNNFDNYSLNFNSNKSGFSGANLNFVENKTRDSFGNIINVNTNKIGFGYDKFNFSTNIVETNANGVIKKDVIENKITYNASFNKNTPINFIKNDNIRRNDKGVLVGASSDITEFKTNYMGASFVLTSGFTQNYQPDGKTNKTDTNSGVVNFKIGNSNISSSLTKNEIINPDSTVTSQDVNRVSYVLPAAKSMPSIEVERKNIFSSTGENINFASDDKLKLSHAFGSSKIVASTSVSYNQNNSNKINDVTNNNLSFSTGLNKKSGNLLVNYNNTNNSMPDKDENQLSLGFILSPNKNLSVASEQIESKIVQSGGYALNVMNTSKYSINYSMPNATLASVFNFVETPSLVSEIVDYKAAVGTDKTFIKLDTSIRMRESNNEVVSLNNDTTTTSIALKPFKNINLSGTYMLNPEITGKQNVVEPVSKRTYNMTSKLGNLNLTGFYTDTYHLPGTSPEIIAKAGNFNRYNETGMKLGYNFGGLNFNGEYKNQSFFGSNDKNINMYSFGLNKKRGERLDLSLSGTLMQNKFNANSINDYKAEAKLNYKF